MSKNTENKVAIVTGASRGIGAACVEQLDDLGWSIAIVSRSEKDLNALAKKLKHALPLALDVAKNESPAEIVSRTLEKFGRIDALVNNAGYAPLLPIEQTTDKIWNDAIAINLTAAFRLCREVWHIFKKQGTGGAIVNISSLAARDPMGGLIAYGAAKAALNNLGITLAAEGAKDAIRVHTIAPAATETQMFRSLPGAENFPRELTMDPAEVASAIVDCLTGRLAHTSGEVIYLRKRT